MNADENYVTQREFDRTVNSIRDSIREGQRRSEDEMRRLNDTVRDALAKLQAQPGADHASLAMQRALDMLDKRGGTGFAGPALGFAVAVILFLLWKGPPW